MDNNYLYFTYGMNIMFYFMMSWMFWMKGSDRLSRLVMVLMAVLGVECVKDLYFIGHTDYNSENIWMLAASIDMVAVPLYAFIIRELCKPGKLKTREIVIHEVSFAIFPILFIITGERLFYDIEVAWAIIYGTTHAIWAMFAIPRYHKILKNSISYDKNVNLGWLRIVLITFIIILCLWLLNCYIMNVNIEIFYLLGAMTMWMFICYFIYKHESVLDELILSIPDKESKEENDTEADLSEIERQIQYQFVTQQLFLNPHLRLSDVATKVGTNRTYLSDYIKSVYQASFREWIAGLRIEYAKQQMVEHPELTIAAISEESGFLSLSYFSRIFTEKEGRSPSKWRKTFTAQEQ